MNNNNNLPLKYCLHVFERVKWTEWLVFPVKKKSLRRCDQQGATTHTDCDGLTRRDTKRSRKRTETDFMTVWGLFIDAVTRLSGVFLVYRHFTASFQVFFLFVCLFFFFTALIQSGRSDFSSFQRSFTLLAILSTIYFTRAFFLHDRSTLPVFGQLCIFQSWFMETKLGAQCSFWGKGNLTALSQFSLVMSQRFQIYFPLSPAETARFYEKTVSPAVKWL